MKINARNSIVMAFGILALLPLAEAQISTSLMDVVQVRQLRLSTGGTNPVSVLAANGTNLNADLLTLIPGSKLTPGSIETNHLSAEVYSNLLKAAQSLTDSNAFDAAGVAAALVAAYSNSVNAQIAASNAAEIARANAAYEPTGAVASAVQTYSNSVNAQIAASNAAEIARANAAYEPTGAVAAAVATYSNSVNDQIAASQIQIFTSTNDFSFAAGTITGYGGTYPVVNIPPAIGGVPVTDIGDAAFQSKQTLASVTIPNTVTNIGGIAFNNCQHLRTVLIPAGVRFIEYDAFNNNLSLESVYFLGNAPSVQYETFLSTTTTVYHLSGATGFGSTFEGRPTAVFGPWPSDMGDVQTKTTADAALPKSGGTMSGDIDMGGHSVTNISTNSLKFANGLKLGTTSNLFTRTEGTTQYTIYDSGNPSPMPSVPVYYADGITMMKTGTTFKVADWIANNLLSLWFETRLNQLTGTGGYIDGPGYVFTDQNGLLVDRCSGQNWKNPGYGNVQEGTIDFIYLGANDPAPSPIWAVTESQITLTPPYAICGWFRTVPLGETHGGQTTVGFPIYRFGSGDWGERIVAHDAVAASSWCLTADAGGSWESFSESGANTFAADTWMMFETGMTAAGQNYLYINGVLAGQTVGNADPDAHTSYLRFWGVPGWIVGMGYMRDCMVLTNEIDAATSSNLWVAQSFDAVRGGAVNAWPMNESTGLVYYASIGAVNLTLVPNLGYDGTETPVTLDFPTAMVFRASMVLVATNAVLSFVASNALIGACVTTTNNLTTNDLLLGVVDLTANTTNWAGSWTHSDSSDFSNQFISATVAMAGTTNLSAAQWVSSNVSVTVKGAAAMCAP